MTPAPRTSARTARSNASRSTRSPAFVASAPSRNAASAAQAVAARERMTQTVMRAGVEVVDAGPDELAPRLADRYLALKAAGRL